MAARRLRIGLGEEHSTRKAVYNLNDELEDMSKDDIEALGQSIFSVLKAKSAKDQDSPILKGKIFANRKTNRGSFEDLVCDSGCTMSVISKSICEDQNIPITPLSSDMIIRNASGNSLNIIGTSKVYIENLKVLGHKGRMIEAAVLAGNQHDRELETKL